MFNIFDTMLLTLVLVILAFILVLAIVMLCRMLIKTWGLYNAKHKFGEYTDAVEYDFGKYLLYDKTSDRLLLPNGIVEVQSISELRTNERPATMNSYRGHKYAIGSTVARAVAADLIAGPVAGAAVGAANASRKKETTEYNIVPGKFTIYALAETGECLAEFATDDEKRYRRVLDFLRRVSSK